MNYHLFNIRAIIFSLILLLGSSQILADDAIKKEADYSINSLLKLTINSSINPATLNYIEYNLDKHHNVDAYLLVMNTPGGLISTTKEIMTTIGGLNKPFIIWVGPSGASATSAGAIIASSSPLLFMAEGTNIGAATPITTAGDLKEKSDMRSKAINDIKALVRSQAQMNDYNPRPFEEMIDKAASYSAKEAKELKVILDIANSEKELLEKIDGLTIKVQGKPLRLSLDSPKVTEAVMDLGQKLLNILSSPNLAYILFLAGAALIYFEFQAPGGFLAGALGVTCLVLSAIGFQVLPLNVGAFALICLSFVLFILEIYITSFGILAMAAVACLISGSMFLFRTDDAYLQISTSVIFSVVGAVLTFMGIVFYVFMRSKKNIGAHKFNEVNLEFGEVIEVTGDGEYMIKSHGEYWKSHGPNDLKIKDKVKVICKNNDLTLNIKKFEG